MINKSRTFEVFVAATRHDAAVADVVQRAFEDVGLTVFSFTKAETGARWGDKVREALAESNAFVAVLTPAALRSPGLTLELGGAIAWNKPIYILLDGIGPSQVPVFLRDFELRPISEIAKVVKAVLRNAQPFSEQHTETLGKLYREIGVPADHLAVRPAELDALTRAFNSECGTKLPPERILQQLLRLRKAGKLPRVQRQRAQRT